MEFTVRAWKIFLKFKGGIFKIIVMDQKENHFWKKLSKSKAFWKQRLQFKQHSPMQMIFIAI